MTLKQKENLKFGGNKKEKRKRVKKVLSVRFFSIILLFAIFGTSINYVMIKNDLSVKGFVINKMQREINSLEDSKLELELKVTSLESFISINDRVLDLNMVKAENISYITSNHDYVAKK